MHMLLDTPPLPTHNHQLDLNISAIPRSIPLPQGQLSEERMRCGELSTELAEASGRIHGLEAQLAAAAVSATVLGFFSPTAQTANAPPTKDRVCFLYKQLVENLGAVMRACNMYSWRCKWAPCMHQPSWCCA